MKKKEKISFSRISFVNKWNDVFPPSSSDWTIIGVSKRWAGCNSFCYKACFFGFELHVWFDRIFVPVDRKEPDHTT